ncbi:MAG: hypothetical protein CSB28_01055 [Desulfobacterales bacterium]|nr:MAG: hypothetical protein CSB28_01055 [Desulfobacterales bacterium]
MIKKITFFLPECLVWMLLVLVFPVGADSLTPDTIIKKESRQNDAKMVLEKAVICEGIESFQPRNPAVVFSISQGELFCFTSFDPVYAKTPIYHYWYNRDKLVFSMRLVLSKPKWSCFSKIQIREPDKGPWRVEILDEHRNIIKTLRFSMVD